MAQQHITIGTANAGGGDTPFNAWTKAEANFTELYTFTVNAAADGATKGISTFTATDFNSTSGLISLDYVNGQKATSSLAGFLSSTDWTTFNNKLSGGTSISGGDLTGTYANPTVSKINGNTIPSNTAGVLTNNGSGTLSWSPPAKVYSFAVSDEYTAITAGTGKITFRVPYAITLTSVRASLVTAQVSGNIVTVDINLSGTTILSTKLTLDNTEKTSTTAAIPPVLSTTFLPDDSEISVDIDQVGNGTATGLKLVLIGY